MIKHPFHIAGLLVFIVCVSMAHAQDADLQRRYDRLLQENQQLRAEIQSLKAALAVAKTQLGDSRTQNQQLSEQRRDLEIEKKRLEELAGLTAKGDPVASTAARFRSIFDADLNRTVVRSTPVRLPRPSLMPAEHMLALSYSHRGERMNEEPQKLWLTIYAFYRPNLRYKGVRSVTFLLDDQKLELPVSGYELISSRRVSSGKTATQQHDEELRIELKKDDLRKLARASTAQLEIAGNKLDVPRDFLASAHAVRERMQIEQ